MRSWGCTRLRRYPKLNSSDNFAVDSSLPSLIEARSVTSSRIKHAERQKCTWNDRHDFFIMFSFYTLRVKQRFSKCRARPLTDKLVGRGGVKTEFSRKTELTIIFKPSESYCLISYTAFTIHTPCSYQISPSNCSISLVIASFPRFEVQCHKQQLFDTDI